MNMVDELQALRQEVAELRDELARRIRDPNEPTIRRVVQTLDHGAYPTPSQVGRYLICDICEIGGEEIEGEVGEITATGVEIPVVLIHDRIPPPGSYLIAKFVDHRWIATYKWPKDDGGGGCAGTICPRVQDACHPETPPGIAGTINVYKGDVLVGTVTPASPAPYCVSLVGQTAGEFTVKPVSNPPVMIITPEQISISIDDDGLCDQHMVGGFEVIFYRQPPFWVFFGASGCSMIVGDINVTCVETGEVQYVPYAWFWQLNIPDELDIFTFMVEDAQPIKKWIPAYFTVDNRVCSPSPGGLSFSVALEPVEWAVCVPRGYPISKHLRVQDGLTGQTVELWHEIGNVWRGFGVGFIPACAPPYKLPPPCPGGATNLEVEYSYFGTGLMIGWGVDPLTDCPQFGQIYGYYVAMWGGDPDETLFPLLHIPRQYGWCPVGMPGGGHTLVLDEVPG